MADLQEFVLSAALDKMSQQKADLREFRARASYILLSASVVNAAFISIFPKGQHVYLMVAMTLYVVGTIFIGITFTATRNWTFSFNLNELVKIDLPPEGYSRDPDSEQIRHIAQRYQTFWNENEAKLNRRSKAMNMGLLFLFLTIIPWVSGLVS